MFLGRALATPRVKLTEDPYQRPELQFFPLRKGPRAAGELIATFELIELDYSGRFEVRIPWPSRDRLWTLIFYQVVCLQRIWNMGMSWDYPSKYFTPRKCRLQICLAVTSLDFPTSGNIRSTHIVGSFCQAFHPRDRP